MTEAWTECRPVGTPAIRTGSYRLAGSARRRTGEWHRNSPIARQSDAVLCIGEVKEPCPLGLTPSASTTAMLALGDALALVLMEKKKFTKADYARFHHGGYLGKKARLEARRESRV